MGPQDYFDFFLKFLEIYPFFWFFILGIVLFVLGSALKVSIETEKWPIRFLQIIGILFIVIWLFQALEYQGIDVYEYISMAVIFLFPVYFLLILFSIILFYILFILYKYIFWFDLSTWSFSSEDGIEIYVKNTGEKKFNCVACLEYLKEFDKKKEEDEKEEGKVIQIVTPGSILNWARGPEKIKIGVLEEEHINLTNINQHDHIILWTSHSKNIDLNPEKYYEVLINLFRINDNGRKILMGQIKGIIILLRVSYKVGGYFHEIEIEKTGIRKLKEIVRNYIL